MVGDSYKEIVAQHNMYPQGCLPCVLVLTTLCSLVSPTRWGEYSHSQQPTITLAPAQRTNFQQNTISDSQQQNGKLQAIVQRGNKMQKIIENLMKRNHQKKREILQRSPKRLISNKLRTESGLNVVIKQIIRNKLKKLQKSAHAEKSPVQILLDQSNSEQNFLDQTVGRSGSFLDRLINVMKEEGNTENTLSQQQLARRPKLLTLNNNGEDEDTERPLKFFEEVGLVKPNLKKSNENKVISQVEEVANENAFNFFSGPLLTGKVAKISDDSDTNNQQEHSSTFSDLTNSFLEEEITAAESETAFLADEIAELLVQLEADLNAEDEMMEKSHNMIQTKIRRFPLEMLLKDKDFVDSVFIRFALMRLPLRTQEIDVSEGFQISKVLQASMAQASAETRSLLEDLRSEPLEGDDRGDRARAIDQSRRQLQKLLNIVSKKI